MITAKPITAAKYVLQEICPYYANSCEIPDSHQLKYAQIKYDECREDADIDLGAELSTILSDDREDKQDVLERIQKKFIERYYSALVKDFDEQYQEYLFRQDAEYENCVADDNYDSRRYDHAA